MVTLPVKACISKATSVQMWQCSEATQSWGLRTSVRNILADSCTIYCILYVQSNVSGNTSLVLMPRCLIPDFMFYHNAAYYNQTTKQYALRSGSAYILQYLPAGNTWTGLQQLLPTGISYYNVNGKSLYGYTYGASVSLYAPNPSGTFYAIVGQSCQGKDSVVMSVGICYNRLSFPFVWRRKNVWKDVINRRSRVRILQDQRHDLFYLAAEADLRLQRSDRIRHVGLHQFQSRTCWSPQLQRGAVLWSVHTCCLLTCAIVHPADCVLQEIRQESPTCTL